jgi:hypothetical protein
MCSAMVRRSRDRRTRCLDVLPGDATPGPRSSDRLHVHPQVPGQLADRWEGSSPLPDPAVRGVRDVGDDLLRFIQRAHDGPGGYRLFRFGFARLGDHREDLAHLDGGARWGSLVKEDASPR